MNILELLKPILKAVTGAAATFVAAWVADAFGAEIDATSLAVMLNSVAVGVAVWAVPNIQK